MKRTLVAAIAISLVATQPASAVSKTPVNGQVCSASGPKSGMSANGVTLYCSKGADGIYAWHPNKPAQQPAQNQSGPSGGQGQQQGSYGKLGGKCSKEGSFAYFNFLLKCDGGKYKYVTSADVPLAPSGGFKTRPNWYPTLSQILGAPGASEPTCSPSTIKFTKSIIPLDQLTSSIPYGAMIGGHVTPIDHAYIGIKSLYKSPGTRTDADYVPVTAPANGTITELSNLGSPTSFRVVIDHGCNIYSVYMVLNKPSGVLAPFYEKVKTGGAVMPNVKIKAGEEFARQRDNPMDFNVFDGTKWLSGFANVGSYLSQDTWKPYTTDFLPYFSSDIRSALENVLQRTSAPRVGKIDYDVVGAASGNWFLDGTNGYGGNFNSAYQIATSQLPGGVVPGKNIYSWSHLAIAPHEVDSTKWIFSTGWWKDETGDPVQALMVISGNKPSPDKLTAASGIVSYQLIAPAFEQADGSVFSATGPRGVGYKVLTTGAVMGVVTLQVNSDASLSVEIDPNATDPSIKTGFTSAKRLYRR